LLRKLDYPNFDYLNPNVLKPKGSGAFLLVAIITSFLAAISAINHLPWKVLTNGIFIVLFLEMLYYLYNHERIENKNSFGTIFAISLSS